ncbi:hypothetical protein, partial [Streptomyces sp. NPDC005877]|uniref:hypothetical protein n=1 Tax=Streptomyces sp. NPDC005877 TaxID=3155346 RepID=UPI0033DE6881
MPDLKDLLTRAQQRGDFWKRMFGRAEADRARADKALDQATQRATAAEAVLTSIRAAIEALPELIWKRTVASQMKDAVGNSVTVRIAG